MRASKYLTALALVLTGTLGAQADQTGMAGIHSWRTVGSKTCFIDHTHDGAGSGPNQQVALREAVKSWESFTDLEYGSDWASYNNSVEKQVSCNPGMGSVTCRVESIPCKGGVLVKQERRPFVAKHRTAARARTVH
jgi:hypothetical protein